MLGPKLEEARGAGHSEEEARLYEWNLRTQLTVWGTSDAGGSQIEDYANREWAGLISSYYKTRCSAVAYRQCCLAKFCLSCMTRSACLLFLAEPLWQ